ncbi:MAG TPA: UDP-N-acetylmuramoyl-L-alanyl-D-glutamate--2,6-diaminopimelate ligase [Rhodocyclaceae bacterium]|nr:UDP-N-acetylmuramoyl-L-alanyl-D-glutamate--2,6-diaminopimelate ligase [Rhodocyclaceae bacterium]
MSPVRDILDRLAAHGVQPAGVTDDSRQVRPGDLFMAYPGDLADGRKYIADAIARGACAILWQPGGDFAWDAAWRVPNLAAPGLRPLAGPLAHEICGFPTENMSLVAITGTNGKTTVSQWVARAHPQRCAAIGTLGAGFPGELTDTGFTTPEATTLMRWLADFRQRDALACALEASSIGIEEGRMNGARVDVAVFTNCTRDHLDYHGTMEAYAAAKEKLFQWPHLRAAVINLDDELGQRLVASTTAVKVLGYTIGDGHRDQVGVIRAENLVTTAEGQRFTLAAPNGKATVETRLVGRYNVSNLLAVAGVLIDAGLSAAETASRLARLQPPPGRMERVGGEGEPLVVVDYAHTPDALENALKALRPLAEARQGKLLAVFGCGGDRDRGKRPLMGEAATRLADQVILTSDNPRREDPAAILADIAPGAPGAEVIIDRAEAIRCALLEADPRDVVLLAGKGHEPYQEVNGVRNPFSDLEQARSALQARRQQDDPAPEVKP